MKPWGFCISIYIFVYLSFHLVLAGNEDFIATSKEDLLSDPPAVLLVDKFDEKYKEAVSIPIIF